MKGSWLNEEERQIMDDLEGLPEPEKVKILEDSVAGEPEESGRRVLRCLVSKLKSAHRGDFG